MVGEWFFRSHDTSKTFAWIKASQAIKWVQKIVELVYGDKLVFISCFKFLELETGSCGDLLELIYPIKSHDF